MKLPMVAILLAASGMAPGAGETREVWYDSKGREVAVSKEASGQRVESYVPPWERREETPQRRDGSRYSRSRSYYPYYGWWGYPRWCAPTGCRVSWTWRPPVCPTAGGR